MYVCNYQRYVMYVCIETTQFIYNLLYDLIYELYVTIYRMRELLLFDLCLDIIKWRALLKELGLQKGNNRLC